MSDEKRGNIVVLYYADAPLEMRGGQVMWFSTSDVARRDWPERPLIERQSLTFDVSACVCRRV